MAQVGGGNIRCISVARGVAVAVEGGGRRLRSKVGARVGAWLGAFVEGCIRITGWIRGCGWGVGMKGCGQRLRSESEVGAKGRSHGLRSGYERT